MPSKSPAQHRLMEAAAHDPQVAKQTGVPQGVAKDFVAADQGKKVAAAIRSLKPKAAPDAPDDNAGAMS